MGVKHSKCHVPWVTYGDVNIWDSVGFSSPRTWFVSFLVQDLHSLHTFTGYWAYLATCLSFQNFNFIGVQPSARQPCTPGKAIFNVSGKLRESP